MSVEGVYRAIYKKYATDLTDEQINEKIKFASSQPNQQAVIDTIYKKYTGKGPTFDQRMFITQKIDPQNVNSIIKDENARRQSAYEEQVKQEKAQKLKDEEECNPGSECAKLKAVEDENKRIQDVNDEFDSNFIGGKNSKDPDYLRLKDADVKEKALYLKEKKLQDDYDLNDKGEKSMWGKLKQYAAKAYENPIAFMADPNFNQKYVKTANAQQEYAYDKEIELEEVEQEIKNGNVTPENKQKLLDLTAELQGAYRTINKVDIIGATSYFDNKFEEIKGEQVAELNTRYPTEEDKQTEEYAKEYADIKSQRAEDIELTKEDFDSETDYNLYNQRKEDKNLISQLKNKLDQRRDIAAQRGEMLETVGKTDEYDELTFQQGEMFNYNNPDNEELRLEMDSIAQRLGMEDGEQIANELRKSTDKNKYIKGLQKKLDNKLEEDYTAQIDEQYDVAKNWFGGGYEITIGADDDTTTFQGQQLIPKPTKALIERSQKALGDEEDYIQSAGKTTTVDGIEVDAQKNIQNQAFQNLLTSDATIKAMMNKYSEEAKPKLEAYKKQLDSKFDFTKKEDVEEANRLLQEKQKELTLDRLYNDPMFKQISTDYGMALDTASRNIDTSFARKDSWFLNTIDKVDAATEYVPIVGLLDEVVEGFVSGAEGMRSSIADKAWGSISGNRYRANKEKGELLNKQIEDGDFTGEDRVYFEGGKFRKWTPESGIPKARAFNAQERSDKLRKDKDYWQSEIVEQIEDVADSEEFLSAFRQSDFEDGISFADAALTVGQSLPHIATAGAGALTGNPVLAYLGTAAMFAQMYGDNYWSAIEKNLDTKGLSKEKLKAQFPDKSKAEIDELYKQEAIGNLQTGEGANMAHSAAMAAVQTALESYGANQVIGGTQKALAGKLAGGQLNMGNLFKSSWDDVGSWMLRGAVEKGGNALEEFGTEFMQEIVGQISTAQQAGLESTSLIDMNSALQAGVGGALTGFFLPFAGSVVNQTSTMLRQSANDIALKYAPESAMAKSYNTSNEWFKQTTEKLENEYKDKMDDPAKAQEYYQKLAAVSNSYNASIKLGLIPGVKAGGIDTVDNFTKNMNEDNRRALLDDYVRIEEISNQINDLDKDDPQVIVLKEELKEVQKKAAEIIKTEKTTENVAKILADAGKTENMIIVDDLGKEAAKKNISLERDADGEIAQTGFFQEDGKFVVDKKLAADLKAGNTAAHELLHNVLQKTLYNVDGEGNLVGGKNVARGLAAALDSEINKLDPNNIKDSDFKKRLELYKKEPAAWRAEEKLTLFADAIESGDLKYNESIFTKIGDQIRRFLQAAGIKDVKFNSGRDVYNFLKDYNASIAKGKLNRAQKKMMNEGAEVGKDIRRFQGTEGLSKVIEQSKPKSSKNYAKSPFLLKTRPTEAKENPKTLKGIQLKAAERTIDRTIDRGIKDGLNAEQIFRKLSPRFGLDSIGFNELQNYINGKISGEITTDIATYRQGKPKNDQVSKKGSKAIKNSRAQDLESMTPNQRLALEGKGPLEMVRDKDGKLVMKNTEIAETLDRRKSPYRNVKGRSGIPSKASKALIESSKKDNKKLQELTVEWQQGSPNVDIENDILPQLEAATISSLKRWGVTAGRKLTFDFKNPEVLKEAKQLIGGQLWSFMENFNQDKSSATTYTDNLAKRIGPKLVDMFAKKNKSLDSMKDDVGFDVVDTSQEGFESKKQKDTSRKKKYPSSLKAVRENITPESKKALIGGVDESGRTTGAAKTIIQGVGQNVNPESVAKNVIASTKDKSVMQQMRKNIGKFGSDSYNQFVNNVVNEGLTKTIPAATIKRRLGRKANVESGLIDYEQTGTTPTIKVNKEGKKTYFDKPVYKINKVDNTKLKEYYKAGEKRQQSLFSMLAEGTIVEGFNDLKQDKAFMDKLNDTLELKGIDMTADQYMSELENNLDQRSKEDTSLDIVKANKVLKTEPSKVEQAKTYVERGLAKDARATMSKMDGVKYITPTFKRGEEITYKKIRTRKSKEKNVEDVDVRLLKKEGIPFKYNEDKTKVTILPYAKTVTEGYGKTPKYIRIESSPEAIRTRRINTLSMRSKMGAEVMTSLAGHNEAFYQFKPANKEALHSVDSDINYKFDENNKADKADLEILRKQKIPLIENKDGTFSLDLKKSKTIDVRVNAKGEIVKPNQKGYNDAKSVVKEAANDQKNYTKWTEKEFKDKAKSKQFRKMQEAKIDMLENISKVIAKDIAANPENKGFWAQWLASQSTGQSGHPIRTLAPIKFFSDIMKGAMRAEHTMPANQVATLIFGMADRNTVGRDFDIIRDNYFQGKITVKQDNKLGVNEDGVNLKEDMPQVFFDILNPKTWYRYVDKSVNNQDGGINMNTLLIYDKDGKVQTVADSFGVGLTKAQYIMADGTVNQNLIQYQNNAIYDMFEKNMDPKVVKERLTAKYTKDVNVKKTQRVDANAKANKVLNPKATTTAQKKTMINSFETKVKANKVLGKKAKGISVFDFDDTLAKTKEKVIVTNANGTVNEISASEFAKQASILTEAGATFDFSNFENVSLDTAEGPLADLARKRQGKFGSKDIFVLTARPQVAAESIKQFLDAIGINIPIENITGLEDGTPQAKVDWILNKTAEGYNDFYFADDSFANVEGVKQVLDAVDIKNKVQVAKANKVLKLDKELNKILEEVTGKESFKTYSKARAILEGRQKDKGFLKRIAKQFSITASADDFKGLTYAFRGKGEAGNRHAKWIQDNLIDPYDKAELELLKAKTTLARDFAELKKQFPSLKSRKTFGFKTENPLLNEIGVGPYTKSHAIRVYMWNKQGMEIPGMSKKDVNALVKAVESDNELNVFADEVMLIQKDSQYPPPDKNWLAGDMKSDILSGLDKGFRNKLLTEWNQNVEVIFSEKNLNKLEAIYGSKYVEALRGTLDRMKTGSNRPNYTGPGSRVVNEMLDWLNSAVGVTMFFNRKSGLLQTLSTVNFINWGDNNIYAAAKAFASKEYYPTVLKLLNSDYLVNRRDGLKINVNEAELANAAKEGGFKGMVNFLLDKGFLFTRIADSLAIATGGATFYINRKKSLLNRINPETGKLYTEAEADQKAFLDFYQVSEETQQSSNPSKISQQQASMAGRVLLAFQNVTMQFNRNTKKSILDFVNRRKKPGFTQRESDLSNMSSVVYYVGMQNLIFNSLQQSLFTLLFDEEEEEEKKNRTKKEKVGDIVNGMIDSLLFGLGFGGAIISTLKNLGLRINEENKKADRGESTDYQDIIWDVFDVSPVLDSKVRKLRTAAKTFDWNREDMDRRGWSLDNPMFLAYAQLISAGFNLPVDRALVLVNSLRQATDENTRLYQRIALALGWSGWSLNLPYWGRQSTVDREKREDEQLKEKWKNSVKKVKKLGFTKKIPLSGPNHYKPEGQSGVDFMQVERPDGTIQYYIKP